MAHSAFVVVLLPEWINWLEQREFRCLAARVRRLDPSDGGAFIRLLATAASIDIEDEGALVIARIDLGNMTNVETAPAFEAGEVIRMSLSLVRSFHAVSERARDLLQSEAHKWGCRLEDPLNAAAFESWQQTEKGRLAHRRGLVVADYFGLGAELPADPAVARLMEMPRERCLDESRRLDHENCCSLGWAEAFAHCRSRLEGDESELRAERGPVVQLVQQRKLAYTLSSESFHRDAGVAAADFAETLLEKKNKEPVAVIATAAYHHFSFYFLSGKTVDETLMKSFGGALAAVKARYDGGLAGILAYSIGRLFPESRVAALDKDRNSDAYSVIRPSPPPFNAAELMRLPDGAVVTRHAGARAPSDIERNVVGVDTTAENAPAVLDSELTTSDSPVTSAAGSPLELDRGKDNLGPSAVEVPVVRVTGGDRSSNSGRNKNKNKNKVKSKAESDSLPFTGPSNNEARASEGKSQGSPGQTPAASESKTN